MPTVQASGVARYAPTTDHAWVGELGLPSHALAGKDACPTAETPNVGPDADAARRDARATSAHLGPPQARAGLTDRSFSGGEACAFPKVRWLEDGRPTLGEGLGLRVGNAVDLQPLGIQQRDDAALV